MQDGRIIATLATLTTLACALALAACGFSGNSSEAASSGGPESPAVAADFLKFSRCMRSHGVPNFPDPTTGHGIQFTSSSGLDPASPAFKSARSACKKVLPGGGPGNAPPPSASDLHQALVWAQCIRKHGVPNFPDPSASVHEGLFFRGVGFAVGAGFNPQSPAFRHAQAACGVGPGGSKG